MTIWSKNPIVLFCTAFCLWALYSNCEAAEKQPPNIVLLFIDDWAWNGSPVPMDDAMENSRMPVLQMPNVETACAGRNEVPQRLCIAAVFTVSRVHPDGKVLAAQRVHRLHERRRQDYYDEKGYKGFPVVPCVSDMTIDEDAVTIPGSFEAAGLRQCSYWKVAHARRPRR